MEVRINPNVEAFRAYRNPQAPEVGRDDSPRARPAVSLEVQSRLSGLEIAQRNAQDAVGALGVFKDGIRNAQEALSNREGLRARLQQLADLTEYQGTPVFKGGQTLSYVVGEGEVIDLRTRDLMGEIIDPNRLDDSEEIESARANLGSWGIELDQAASRLDKVINSLAVYEENVMATLSETQDIERARESLETIRASLETPAAILAQAQLSPERVLRLLS